MNKNDETSMPEAQLNYLNQLKEILSTNYKAAMGLYEMLTFLSELAGSDVERKIKLSETGANGLQRLFMNLAQQAEIAACEVVFDFQLDELVAKGRRQRIANTLKPYRYVAR